MSDRRRSQEAPDVFDVSEIDRAEGDPGRSLLAPNESLPAWFERVAAAHRSRAAIGSGPWQPTYEELNASANRVAYALMTRAGRAGDRVAILMRHDAPQIAAMLAVLKAGRIAVVLNPADPPVRLQHVLSHAGAESILTDASCRERAADIAQRDRIILFEEEHAEGPIHNPAISIAPDDTAFLVYTSGSTGQPKAVMQTHRQVLQKVGRLFHGTGVGPADRIALLAALSGGQGIGTAWCALANGAALCPFPVMEKGVIGLADWMNDEAITFYLSSASLFRNLVKALPVGGSFPRMRAVMIASEVATSEDFKAFQRHFADSCLFVHMLSSSETGNIARLVLSRSDVVGEGRLPVGTAAEGVEILLVDEQGHEIPRGATGEITVRSRYLSAGYWRDAALSAERFSEAPGGEGIRIFRSGDLGRINDRGLLEFVGRNDARLKIRGYRIEASEVEHALRVLPAVNGAAVGTVERPDREPLLAAYVVLRVGQAACAAELRRQLRATLPRHLVPSVFVFLDELPLTSHGKIDRGKLRQIRPSRVPPSADRAVTQTETLLADLWAEVFELAPIGRQDDFFDLGGDSLIAAVIAAKLHAQLGVELNLGVFIDHPVLADLAAAVDAMCAGQAGSSVRPLMRRPQSGHPPQSLLQERIWLTSRTAQHSARYTVARSYRIEGPIEAEVLRECVNEIVRRHEMLRTTFEEADGQPVQLIHALARIPLSIMDVSKSVHPEAEARALCRREAATIFDLSQLPLLRFSLIRVRENEHWLLRVNHGIIADGWSWQVFFRELAVLYDAKLRGETPSLPDPEVLQFADYAVWQRSAMEPNSPVYRAAVDWWHKFLRNAPRPAELPFKRAKSIETAEPGEGVVKFSLDPDVSRRLEEIGRAQDATYYMVRMAAFALLLAAETGQRDVTVGAFVTRRNRLALQNMIGLFGNQVRLRFRCAERDSFRRWLSRVRDVVIETEARGDIPYEQLCGELKEQGVRLRGFYTFFNIFQFAPTVRFADLSIEELDWYTELMPAAFMINFNQYNEQGDCRATFDARAYDPAGARAFIDRLCRLFDAASRHPDRSIGELLAMSGVRRPGVLGSWVHALSRATRMTRTKCGK